MASSFARTWRALSNGRVTTPLRPQRVSGDGRQQRLQWPYLDPIFSFEPPVAKVDEHTSHEARELGDGPQPRQLRRGESRLRLDLERQILSTAPQQEVDLRPASLRRRPVRNLLEKNYPTSLA